MLNVDTLLFSESTTGTYWPISVGRNCNKVHVDTLMSAGSTTSTYWHVTLRRWTRAVVLHKCRCSTSWWTSRSVAITRTCSRQPPPWVCLCFLMHQFTCIVLFVDLLDKTWRVNKQWSHIWWFGLMAVWLSALARHDCQRWQGKSVVSSVY